MKAIWRRWKAFAHRLIDYQNRFLMGVVYVTAVAPVALVFKLMGRKLLDRGPADESQESYWVERTEPPLDMKRASRMF
jgi:hypothetical protein